MGARLALAQLLAGHAYAVVPVEPTAAMLEAGCPDKLHKAGQSVPGEQAECIYIGRRRTVWADMLLRAPTY